MNNTVIDNCHRWHLIRRIIYYDHKFKVFYVGKSHLRKMQFKNLRSRVNEKNLWKV